jgi:mannose-6-phosphate isomerase-like protein (cupin superfamily)
MQAVEKIDTYARWVAEQDVPVFEGFYLPSILDIEVGDWASRGGRGAIVRLAGAEDMNDAYICEIPAGGSLHPQRHLYEELVYIVEGQGATRLRNGRGDETTFEWQPGSVFSIPLNTEYQHFNLSGRSRVRYYAVTSAPLMMRLFHNQDFLFNCPFDFTDRFGSGRAEYSGEGTAYAERVWETNFIADVRALELHGWNERGAGGRNVMLELGDSSMCGHVSEFPVGTYKKAHRHRAGAHVIILSGEGYSLLWREGDEVQKVDWQAGSVVVPPDRWFHQHFNAGGEPARYLALRWGSKKYPVFKNYRVDRPTTQGGDQLEYEDEAPLVRETFEAELARRGLTSKMQAVYEQSGLRSPAG